MAFLYGMKSSCSSVLVWNSILITMTRPSDKMAQGWWGTAPQSQCQQMLFIEDVYKWPSQKELCQPTMCAAHSEWQSNALCGMLEIVLQLQHHVPWTSSAIGYVDLMVARGWSCQCVLILHHFNQLAGWYWISLAHCGWRCTVCYDLNVWLFIWFSYHIPHFRLTSMCFFVTLAHNNLNSILAFTTSTIPSLVHTSRSWWQRGWTILCCLASNWHHPLVLHPHDLCPRMPLKVRHCENRILHCLWPTIAVSRMFPLPTPERERALVDGESITDPVVFTNQWQVDELNMQSSAWFG